MTLALLGMATAAIALWVSWLLVDGAGTLLARRRVEARKRAARVPLSLVVTARDDATPELFRLTLARADGRPLPRFKAGQYLTVRTPEGVRRYSLSAWAARPSAYHLGIRRVDDGRVSRWLHEHARPGMPLEVLPPSGHFILEAGAGDVVLVGGGIGLTPMAAMVDALACRSAGRVWLFHAARHEAELIGYERYAELDRATHWFNYRPFLSRPDENWHGGRGRLTAAELTCELASTSTAHYYLCARQDMMDELAASLAALGIPAAHIHWESFGGAGNADSSEYTVAIAGHGAHTFQGEPSLLHALESWGIPVKADCRAGECGACRLKLLEGEVADCQPSLYPLPPGEVLACCKVPRSSLRLASPASIVSTPAHHDDTTCLHASRLVSP